MIIDLFAGGGGASTGIEAALGRKVDIAINHDPTAMAVHAANHPETVHMTASVWEARPLDVTKGEPVELLWASPDCCHFSVAKGGKPRSKGIRSLAWVVVRWAREVRPAVICLENVAEFQGWGPLGPDGLPVKAKMGVTFRRWKRKLESYGYVVDHRILDSSLHGAPTKRRRLFLVARCDGNPIAWPTPTHGPGRKPVRTAAECIDWSIPCPSIFGRKRPLAEKTLRRIAQGIKRFVLENPDPFVVDTGNAVVAPTLIQTGYGERKGQRPRYLDLHQPLGTVMANGQKHALVVAFLAKHFTGVVGQKLDQPASTITAVDHHSLVTAHLFPLHVEATNDNSKVRAFLTVFYGVEAGGQQVMEPMRTITAKHRFGLVTIKGTEYQIVDIGLRMLAPHELLRAQFGRFAASYDMTAAKTQAAKVRLIGNSVCPEVAEALVRANVSTSAQERLCA